MRLLVVGAAGMLGHDVLRAGERAGDELLGVDLPDVDITDRASVRELIDRVGRERGELDGVVNCAAWTDVDGAESCADAARAVNATGAGVLASEAARAGVPLLQLSTDYVFDGVAPRDAGGRARPYVESDPTGPRSVYGATKLEGEREVLSASPRHLVVRTAWLYGADGKNFVETMLRLAGEQAASGQRPSVRVVTDQVGSPTWGGHLAPALLGLLRRGVAGVAHLTGGGEVSWNDFAREIFRQAEVDCLVEPASSDELARAAPRPAWSALASERDDVLPLPPWQDGLAAYLAARAGMMRA
jgi:dTDP-4-dehydrorhamnose reductase